MFESYKETKLPITTEHVSKNYYVTRGVTIDDDEDNVDSLR